MSERQSYQFQAEVNEVLGLVINSLYSHKEVFLRELVSNASDALEKLEFRALTEHSLLADDAAKEIRIIPDPAAGILTIEDTGVGMTREELVENLGTIARSGSRQFAALLEQAKEAAESGQLQPNLIGQFGVGFYSSYLVADQVEVVSRAAGAEDAAWRWASDAKGEFTVEPAERAQRGTSVTLHFKEDQKELLSEWQLRNLITRYSDFVSFPIKLQVTRPGELEDADGNKIEEKTFETVNRANALWRRKKSDIPAEEYDELYKHLTHDFEEPLAHTHFTLEGTQSFVGLLYVPKRAPMDLFDPNHRRGVRLYVKRVFIMDDCEELVPQWLRFMRGVIDSDDLELNVSREILQKSAVVRVMSKQIIKRTLDLLEELAADRAEDYTTFWDTFGAVLKEGLHFDLEHRERLAKLARYHSSAGDDLTSLAAYVERMPEGQSAIYYAIGESTRSLGQSPHLEALRKRGYEVLYMTDPVDEWAVAGLGEFDSKKLVSAMQADLELGDDEKTEDGDEQAEGADADATAGKLAPLLERIQSVLGERVEKVTRSTRLTDSPCCLVVPAGGLPPHMERMLRGADRDAPPSRRILEVNAGHPLIQNLEELIGRDDTADEVSEWVDMLYEQARIAEGSPLEDAQRFARNVTRLMEGASKRLLGAES